MAALRESTRRKQPVRRSDVCLDLKIYQKSEMWSLSRFTCFSFQLLVSYFVCEISTITSAVWRGSISRVPDRSDSKRENGGNCNNSQIRQHILYCFMFHKILMYHIRKKKRRRKILSSDCFPCRPGFLLLSNICLWKQLSSSYIFLSVLFLSVPFSLPTKSMQMMKVTAVSFS